MLTLATEPRNMATPKPGMHEDTTAQSVIMLRAPAKIIVAGSMAIPRDLWLSNGALIYDTARVRSRTAPTPQSLRLPARSTLLLCISSILTPLRKRASRLLATLRRCGSSLPFSIQVAATLTLSHHELVSYTVRW